FCNANSGELVEGKWDEPYADGTDPDFWTGSGQIFADYLESGTAVKYGQCWVFAGILTTLGRTAGIPSRPVTNYESGHDTDANKTIDFHLDCHGRLDVSRSDTIWNFHVWTEMWMKRTAGNSFDGWQVVDATPQERSNGKYQCGPASRIGVKASVNGDYDVAFVVSEVNAPIKVWQDDETGVETLVSTIPDKIGISICTKKQESNDLQDLTSEYK
ncbi:MAG: transglutaminase domain-containing protein, partial [Kiritimatiellae bacterium]|nr:transglutaminase domain-containing protein [Kiritimatiellia bacterium]